MELIKKNIQDLIPAAYNPRKDLQPGDPEYEKLKRSLDEFGYVEPVIWNKRTGNVVGGHQRLKVLQQEGISEIDCVVIDMDTEKEKALNIALNKISGDWDTDKLALLITDLQGSDFDVSLTGFDPAELDDLFKDDIKDGVHDDDFDVDLEKVPADSFVMFYSGFIEEEGYGSARYFKEHPQLSDELIEKLVDLHISLIGVDFAGIRRGREHPVKDQYCADHGVFVIENMCNLKELLNKDVIMNTYPMRYQGMTGLPCRVVAETM